MDTLEILSNCAPAALTEVKSETLVKPSYGFVNSGAIVERFQSAGWMLDNAKQAKVRTVERQGYQKHLLRFRNDAFPIIPGLTNENRSIPELVVENSHDGSSALRIFFGVFRIVCLNGIIAGNVVNSMRVIHSSQAIKNLDSAIAAMTGSVPELLERVSRYGNIQLPESKQFELAQAAAEIRLRNTPGWSQPYLLNMLRPKRYADTPKDAFSVFNVLQEKVIRGGIEFIQLQEDGRTKLKTTRAVNSVSQSVKLNRELWDAFETIAA